MYSPVFSIMKRDNEQRLRKHSLWAHFTSVKKPSIPFKLTEQLETTNVSDNYVQVTVILVCRFYRKWSGRVWIGSETSCLRHCTYFVLVAFAFCILVKSVCRA